MCAEVASYNDWSQLSLIKFLYECIDFMVFQANHVLPEIFKDLKFVSILISGYTCWKLTKGREHSIISYTNPCKLLQSGSIIMQNS